MNTRFSLTNLALKMAAGLADDLASTVLLATDKPVLVAPAMNVRMWLHPATQANVASLVRRGVHCPELVWKSERAKCSPMATWKA